MSNFFAMGRHAIGNCSRCGFKYRLGQLRPDGENNLLVCDECFDIRHPAKTPINTADAQVLRRPAPDLDATASRALVDDRPLGEVLFGTAPFFGEQP